MTALACGAATDTGRVRSENQDRFSCDLENGLFVVADGMGGAAAGDVAASMVVGLLPKYLAKYVTAGIEDRFDERIGSEFKAAVANLSRDIHDKSAQSLRHAGMGSTVVVVKVLGEDALVAHLGDSRVYVLRNGALTQVSRDHTLAQALIDSGDMSATEVGARSGLRRLTMHIGMSDPAEPDVVAIRFRRGDRLVLCTDGLTTMISDGAIAKLLQMHPDPETACTALVGAANDAGGKDNTTVVVVQMTDDVVNLNAEESTVVLDQWDDKTVRFLPEAVLPRENDLGVFGG